ncbi:MAG: hypothetical protein P8H63_03895 [Flavobacteriaceae bacterium]|nr:hypothetical protein [Flavobacteriaceae bacterium]
MNKLQKYFTLNCIFFLALTISCSKDATSAKPVAPILISPTNGDNCNTSQIINSSQSTVEFTWEVAEGADLYSLYITNLDTQQSAVESDIKSNSFTRNLTRGYPYQWYVQSISDAYPSEKPTSEFWNFYLPSDGVSNSPPFPANLVSPAPASEVEVIEGLVKLVWSTNDPDNDQVSYILYFDTVDGLQSPDEQYTDLTSTSIEISAEPDKVYYWRIYSRDSFQNGSFSQVHSFRTSK